MLKISRKYIGLGLGIYLLYLLGLVFPELFWAFHSIGFLYTTVILGLCILAFFLILTSNKSLVHKNLEPLIKELGALKSNIWIFLMALSFFGLFYHFQIFKDYYGEAYLLQNIIENVPNVLPKDAHSDLFSFSLAPWAGQKTIFAMITYIAYYLQVSYLEIVRWFDAFFGFLFILTWLFFIKNKIQNKALQIILFLSIASSPILLNFFGHIEINAPVYFILSLLMQGLIYLKQKNTFNNLFKVVLLWLVALKLHSISLLFLPLIVLMAFKVKQNKFNLNWKTSFSWIIAPIMLTGLIAYIFVFKDYADNRILDYNVGEYEHLFLPIFSPEAPLDRYNLFSWNHLFDYFNLLFLWSPIAIFLLLVLAIFYGKKLNWNSEAIVISGTGFILFFLFFFMTNPLLSMQMDWDLFSFPAPILFAFVICIVQENEERIKDPKTLLLISIAIGLLSLPFLTVHFNRQQLSDKLLSLGKRIYPTYYAWSSQTINYGLYLTESLEQSFGKRNEIIYELESNYEIQGKNSQLGRLYQTQGGVLLKKKNKPEEAYSYLERALNLDPSDNISRFWQMETCIILEDYYRAYEHALVLSEKEFPDKNKASIALVECALFAEYYDNALEHSITHLKAFPKDSVMMEINYRLQNNLDIATLKGFFIFEDLDEIPEQY